MLKIPTSWVVLLVPEIFAELGLTMTYRLTCWTDCMHIMRSIEPIA
jgi:hypothetical protein